jgi:uncharacterized protein YlzI (FlbEa/FlbD family)
MIFSETEITMVSGEKFHVKETMKEIEKMGNKKWI